MSKEVFIAPATSWYTCHTQKKNTGRCIFPGGCNCNLYSSKFPIFQQVTVHSYFPILMRFSLKPAIKKLKSWECAIALATSKDTCQHTEKKPQVTANFWGDAIVIFFTSKSPIFTSTKTLCGALYSKARQTKDWSPRGMPLHQQHPGTLAETQKKPQVATTFWGDAIVIFT